MTLLAQAAGTDPAEVVFFWIFSVLAIGAGLAVITLRNIVHGALMLVLNLLAIAGLFLLLGSAFLSIVQVLVYAGAVMVLFLFVIMLLGIDRDDLLRATRVSSRVLAVAGGVALAAMLVVAFVGPYTGQASICDQAAVAGDGVRCIGLDGAYAEDDGAGAAFLGARMFTRFTWPFELAALLLTVATIGAVILARRRDLEPEDEDLDPRYVLPAGDTDGGELGVDVAPDDPSDDVSRTDEREG